MELGILKDVFINWAKKHQQFNYNKYTKRLTIHGKHFEELHEPLQQTLVLSFLDQIGISICVAPVLSFEHWAVVVLTNDVPKKISILYEHPDKDKSLTSRFEAMKFGINWYVEYLNKG